MPDQDMPTAETSKQEIQEPLTQPVSVIGLPEGGLPNVPTQPIVGKFWPKPTKREWFIIIILIVGFAVAGTLYWLQQA